MNIQYGSIFVVARDRENRAVLLGGLGSVGVGRAWSDEIGAEAYAGFENAPEACSLHAWLEFRRKCAIPCACTHRPVDHSGDIDHKEQCLQCDCAKYVPAKEGANE